MENNIFGTASEANLLGVHPDMVRVTRRALIYCACDISVVDGLRTLEEQKKYVDEGKSWTMDSRHLPGPDGLAFAVDLYPYVHGKTNHHSRWYVKIARAMFRAAIEEGVDIEWGGFWGKSDKPHWQLSKRKYPCLRQSQLPAGSLQ